jgi:hypothetical protein
MLAGHASRVPVAPALDGSSWSVAVDDDARSDAGGPRACGRRGPYPAVLGPAPPADPRGRDAIAAARRATTAQHRRWRPRIRSSPGAGGGHESGRHPAPATAGSSPGPVRRARARPLPGHGRGRRLGAGRPTRSARPRQCQPRSRAARPPQRHPGHRIRAAGGTQQLHALKDRRKRLPDGLLGDDRARRCHRQRRADAPGAAMAGNSTQTGRRCSAAHSSGSGARGRRIRPRS